jgi:hypothetical protein
LPIGAYAIIGDYHTMALVGSLLGVGASGGGIAASKAILGALNGMDAAVDELEKW